MKQNFNFLLVLLGLSAFFSCKNDFDVNGEWKEIMVVYGLLNPGDSAHFIKINKTYLGKGDAYEMAAIPDSQNYKQDEITATLERLNSGGGVVETILLSYDTSMPKESGLFSNVPNVLFKTTTPIVYEEGGAYRLTINNIKTGKSVTSTTKIVGPISISSPNVAATMDMINNYDRKKNPFRVRWSPAKNAKVYQLIVRFFYEETDITSPGVTTEKSIDWVFGKRTSETSVVEEPIYGVDFFKFLGVMLPENSNLSRKALGVEFRFSVGGTDLYNYTEISQVSIGIVQEKPVYSNIEGGTGLFSSRSVQSTPRLKLSPATITALDTSEYTKNLGF